MGKMNIILFSAAELKQTLSLRDPRLDHVIRVLKLRPGERFDAGLRNGPRGEAWYSLVHEQEAMVSFHPIDEQASVLPPLYLACAYNRPQTMRRMLLEGTALGVAAWHFFPAQKGDPNYSASRLWQTDEWERRLTDGVSQAFTTGYPKVFHHGDLASVETALKEAAATGWVLDNYQGAISLGTALRQTPAPPEKPVVLWAGPERGWADEERKRFIERDWPIVHLGSRVLKSDTAMLAAQALVLDWAGQWRQPTPPGCRWKTS